MNVGSLYQRWRIALLVGGVVLHTSPIAWAQLETVDPALHAAVEALVTADPVIANDPELAEICRQVAEATVLDPRERAAVTHEVAELHREGVDLSTVIPQEVREAAREQFTQVQSQMREQLESLQATDPEKAKEIELMIQEGERQMAAFENGEHYTPSPEMVQHAEGMFKEWESDMVAKGAPPEFVERARQEFTRWSGGEMEMGWTGPGHEMGGPGPGGMPSTEQMEQMVANGQMTPEQLEMAKAYMEQGGPGPGGFEGMGPGGFEAFGPMEGGMEHYGPGPGGFEAMSPQEAFAQWEGSAEASNVSPEQMEQYREMAEQYQQEFEQFQPENQNYDNLQQQQFDLGQPPPPQPEVLVATHDHNNDTVPDEYHYDTNGDNIADHAHPTPH